MSAETASSTETQTLYIPLLEEGTSVVRPTQGVRLGENVYRVLPTPDYDPDDERWAFPPGTLVECTAENRGGHEVLVAKRTAAAT